MGWTVLLLIVSLANAIPWKSAGLNKRAHDSNSNGELVKGLSDQMKNFMKVGKDEKNTIKQNINLDDGKKAELSKVGLLQTLFGIYRVKKPCDEPCEKTSHECRNSTTPGPITEVTTPTIESTTAPTTDSGVTPCEDSEKGCSTTESVVVSTTESSEAPSTVTTIEITEAPTTMTTTEATEATTTVTTTESTEATTTEITEASITMTTTESTEAPTTMTTTESTEATTTITTTES